MAYNAHYQNSHVFYLAGQSRLSLNFSLAFLPPVGLSLQVAPLAFSCLELCMHAAPQAERAGHRSPLHASYRPQHARVPIELDHRLAPAAGIGCVDGCPLASGAPSSHEQQRGGGSRAGGGIWPGEARPHASRGQGCLGCHNQRVILPPPTVCLLPACALIARPRACKCLSCFPACPTLASERACGASWLTAHAIKWRVGRCAIKQQYEPPSHGGYVSEQWQVPARALRKGPNVLVWDYLQGSTTHYWLQSIRLFSDAPPIFPHPPTLEPRTTDREEGV